MHRRDQIISFVKDNYIGPLLGMEEEIIEKEFPRDHYYSGILFPDKYEPGVLQTVEKVEFIEEPSILIDLVKNENQSTEKGNSLDSNSDEEEDIISQSNKTAYQAAMSITCVPEVLENSFVTISGGWYEDLSVRRKEIATNGKEYIDKELKFKRHSILISNVRLDSIDERYKDYDLKITTANDCPLLLKLKLIKRDSGIITISLINYTKVGEKSLDSYCLFQSKIKVENKNGFKKINESRAQNGNSDFESNRLLYRNKKVMASGHGCSVNWEETDSVKSIASTFLPEYTLKDTEFVHSSLKILNLNLSMLQFANLNGNENESNFKVLEKLVNCYEEWINKEFDKEKLLKLDSGMKNTALKHKEECLTSKKRMLSGISLLKNNKSLLKAFNLMNEAMLMQQLHYKLPENTVTLTKDNKFIFSDKFEIPDIYDDSTWYNSKNNTYGSWRPFQMAFILLNIEGLINIDSKERKIVDLIWFSTGGGKTEAYLGLTSLIIFFRKIIDKSDNGTRVIMRYTLRLLATQQFSRATALICACEDIRSRNEVLLGKNRITCGYYVGNGTTPGKYIDANDIVNEDKYQTSSLVLLKCPWCGAPLGRKDFDIPEGFSPPKHSRIVNKYNKYNKITKYLGYNASKKSFNYTCENPKCKFHEYNNSIPVSVIDEQLYKEPPTLIIGTVDKYAMLPFNIEASLFFGNNGKQKNLPPDLIIQDELHLISGPLGSTVGIYETLISNLCADENSNLPKIVASTATISMCEAQCKSLYGIPEKNVKQFPPKGLTYNDSFFSIEKKDPTGRKYVGIMSSSNHSASWSAIKIYSSIIAATEFMDINTEIERDPYWTIVGYYNSLKELAKASTWASVEIPERYKVFRKEYLDKSGKSFKKMRLTQSKNYIELTSRSDSARITKDLKTLEDGKYSGLENNKAADFCFATNMISVGVDIDRLGLMLISGQPKTTSEYIQASSRVGRNSENPGLVFTLYSSTKPRDRSHFEQFQMYHSKLYSSVEPTSVTPFSEPLIKRTLHSIVITFVLYYRKRLNIKGVEAPDKKLQNIISKIILDRVKIVDPEAIDNVRKILGNIYEKWEKSTCTVLEVKSLKNENKPLIYRAGDSVEDNIKETCFPVMTSMRSVDNECVIDISNTKN